MRLTANQLRQVITLLLLVLLMNLKEQTPSRVSFGFDIVTGFNYYFAEQLYIGAEIGIGFKATSYDDDETASGKDESSAEFETFACPSLILGWTF